MKRLSFEIGDNRAEVRVRTPRELTRKRASYAHAPRVTIPNAKKEKGGRERERGAWAGMDVAIHREYNGTTVDVIDTRETEREREIGTRTNL